MTFTLACHRHLCTTIDWSWFNVIDVANKTGEAVHVYFSTGGGVSLYSLMRDSALCGSPQTSPVLEPTIFNLKRGRKPNINKLRLTLTSLSNCKPAPFPIPRALAALSKPSRTASSSLPFTSSLPVCTSTKRLRDVWDAERTARQWNWYPSPSSSQAICCLSGTYQCDWWEGRAAGGTPALIKPTTLNKLDSGGLTSQILNRSPPPSTPAPINTLLLFPSLKVLLGETPLADRTVGRVSTKDEREKAWVSHRTRQKMAAREQSITVRLDNRRKRNKILKG